MWLQVELTFDPTGREISKSKVGPKKFAGGGGGGGGGGGSGFNIMVSRRLFAKLLGVPPSSSMTKG